MPFGTYLHQERLAHQWPRADFAERLGITLAQLSALEANRVLPSYAELQRLGALLQVSPVDLLAHAGYLHPVAPTRSGRPN